MVNKRTNITVKDSELWAWAFGRAKQLQLKNVSEYVFMLISYDCDGDCCNDNHIKKYASQQQFHKPQAKKVNEA